MSNTLTTIDDDPFVPIEVPPEYKLKIAAKQAGFTAEQLKLVLDLKNRNSISDMQRPGKVANLNRDHVLRWSLATGVRPSDISPEYAEFDELAANKLRDLKRRGISFAEELLGYDPRETEPPEEEEEEGIPDFLVVEPRSDPSGWLTRYLSMPVAER